MKLWKLEDNLAEPREAEYSNPKSITKLIFNDRLNTSYTVEHEPIENLEIGYQMSYKDYIKNALDPNVETNANVYGIAKQLKPLTTRINEMRSNIDNANSAYFDLKKRVEEQEQQQETQAVPSTEKGPQENVQ